MSTTSITVARLGALSEASGIVNEFVYQDVDSLLQAPPHEVVIIDQGAEQSVESLKILRGSAHYSHALIYSTQPVDARWQSLCDGFVPDADSIIREGEVWRSRHATLGSGEGDWSLESSMLAWLWLRPGRQLWAERDASLPDIYVYPIVEALCSQFGGNVDWAIQFASSEGWIEAGDLIDRIRLCQGCGSGHLNYVDVCPECQSLSIKRQPSLHCFVCGHVGPQESFTKDRGLFCPNCMSRLRHIGSDYDRPMENYTCRSCGAFFVDASVEAHCLDCGKRHQPEDLKVREVMHYTLTEAGRMRCRQGLRGDVDIAARFHFSGLLAPATFTGMVSWLLDVVHRYKRPTFSLVGIHLVNFQETLNALGESKAYALLDAMAARMVEIIRDTDRCTRAAEDVIWLLLPETDGAGARRAVERLRVLMDDFERANVEVDVRVTRFTAPGDLREGETAELLLRRLLGEITG